MEHLKVHKIRKYNFRFKLNHLKPVVPEHHNYTIGLAPHQVKADNGFSFMKVQYTLLLQINASDVDFWEETFHTMKLKQKENAYPPYIIMTVVPKVSDSFVIPIKFEGCSQENKLDMDLTFPLGTTTLI